MLLYIDIDRQIFISSASVSSKPTNLRLKRGDTGNIRIQFVSAGLPVTLPAAANVELGIKPVGLYDTAFLAFAENFTEPVSPDTEYTTELGLNVAALNTALGKDLVDTNDVAFIEANLEVSWDKNNDDKWLSSETLKIKIDNDVIRGDEETPTLLPTPETWLSARAVRFDEAQTLDTFQLEQVFANLGIPGYFDLATANAALGAIGRFYYDQTDFALRQTTSAS